MSQLQVILLTAEPAIDRKATELERIASLYDSDEHCNDCEHEQDTYVRAQGMKRNHPEQPKDQENYGDCPQHGYLPFRGSAGDLA